MHYDTKLPKQIKSPEEIVFALNENPLTRETTLRMIQNGVKVEFIKCPENRGFAFPSKKYEWLISIHYELSDREKEEIIWHEFVHLHLRRIFGCLINDSGLDSEEVHPLIVKEGARLAKEKPLNFQELLDLLKLNNVV